MKPERVEVRRIERGPVRVIGQRELPKVRRRRMRNTVLKIFLIGLALFACVVVMLGVAGIIPQTMLTTFILGMVVIACFVFGVGLMMRLPFLTLRASLLSLAAIVAVMLGLMWLLPNLIAFRNVEPFHSNILVPTVLILLVLLLISSVIHRR